MILCSSLNTAVDRLIENVDKHEITDDDDIVVDEGFKFSCSIFEKLQPDE